MSTEDYIKQVIRHNLVVEVELDESLKNGKNLIISLLFRNQRKPFSREVIFLPEGG